jgi:alpha-beta hydrolase superfamily lysophospholipase
VSSIVLFIHGIGLHGSSPPYGEKILISQLMGRGTAFYSIDLRGHGRSGGGVDGLSQNTLVQDLDRHVKHIKEQHKSARIFLYGHNFGGILSLHYASQYPDSVRGIIVSEYSKLIKESVKKLREPNAVAAIKDRIAERIYHRSKKLEFLASPDYERLCDKYGIPLDTGIMRSLETSGSAGKCMLYGRDFFTACGVGQEARIAKAVRLPLLMIFSRNDPFFDIKGAYDILTRVQSYDKELIQVDAAGHYGIVEASKDIVGKWVLSRV